MPYQNAPWLESQGKGKEKKKKDYVQRKDNTLSYLYV